MQHRLLIAIKFWMYHVLSSCSLVFYQTATFNFEKNMHYKYWTCVRGRFASHFKACQAATHSSIDVNVRPFDYWLTLITAELVRRRCLPLVVISRRNFVIKITSRTNCPRRQYRLILLVLCRMIYWQLAAFRSLLRAIRQLLVSLV